MQLNNRIKIGDKVNIHHFLGSHGKREPITSGVVNKIRLSDDLSYHGSPWYEECYYVQGDDGKEYYGTYGSDYIHYGYGWHTYFT